MKNCKQKSQVPPPANIHESFTLSKKGDQIRNEDALHVGDRFIAVIDGVTAKTAAPVAATMSSGRFAAQTICELLAAVPDLLQPQEILQWINQQLKQAIAGSVFAESAEGPLASVILFDSHTNTVISYGDCQILLQGQVYKQEKSMDIQLSKKRSEILRAAVDRGISEKELLQNDIGRAEIVQELLAYSSQYANRPGGGFPVLGRGNIIPEYIETYPISSGQSVILASDGYPILSQTLGESEMHLKRIITEDPLLIREYLSTKGVVGDNVSYDDRTYIRFTVY